MALALRSASPAPRRSGVSAIMASAAEPMAVLDERGTIQLHNRAFSRLLGEGPGGVSGTSIWDFTHARHRAGLRFEYARALQDTAAAGERLLRLTGNDGVERRLSIRISNLLADPEVAGVVLTARDVSRLAEAEDQLLHGAVHDRSTGLPGRPALLDAVAKAQRDGLSAAVLLLEIEGFASVRGGFGLRAGDQFVVAACERIRASLGPSDFLTRLDGDQIGLLHRGGNTESTAKLADAVQRALRRPLLVDGKSAVCTSRIGIALDDGQTDPNERIRRAALACTTARFSSAPRVATYHSDMDASVADRMDVETGLRRALERSDELDLHLQPIIDLATHGVTAFEALVRWRHPERGLLGAGAFVPHAEESDLIVEVGWWVLDRVTSEVGRRVRAGDPVVPVHVNVAPAQVASGELVRRVRRSLDQHGCPADLLHLEVTESATTLSPDEVAETLTALRAMGIAVSIDDFGTGQSSLSYLHRFPATTLKIDRAFVSGISEQSRQAPLVRAIIAVAHELGLGVVAEGIETADEATFLRDLGCELGQGYHFSRPVSADAAYRLLESASGER